MRVLRITPVDALPQGDSWRPWHEQPVYDEDSKQVCAACTHRRCVSTLQAWVGRGGASNWEVRQPNWLANRAAHQSQISQGVPRREDLVPGDSGSSGDTRSGGGPGSARKVAPGGQHAMYALQA